VMAMKIRRPTDPATRRPGRGLPVVVRRSRAAPAVACMGGLSPGAHCLAVCAVANGRRFGIGFGLERHVATVTASINFHDRFPGIPQIEMDDSWFPDRADNRADSLLRVQNLIPHSAPTCLLPPNADIAMFAGRAALRPIGKSRGCSRMTAWVKPVVL
jgi:hypothetical protein